MNTNEMAGWSDGLDISTSVLGDLGKAMRLSEY